MTTAATTKYTGTDGCTMPTEVTEAADTTSMGSSDFVLYISKTTMSKKAAINAVEAIKNKLLTDTWP